MIFRGAGKTLYAITAKTRISHYLKPALWIFRRIIHGYASLKTSGRLARGAKVRCTPGHNQKKLNRIPQLFLSIELDNLSDIKIIGTIAENSSIFAKPY